MNPTKRPCSTHHIVEIDILLGALHKQTPKLGLIRFLRVIFKF